MKTADDLRQLLNRIDHKGYPAYKDTKGIYQFPEYRLSIDHVQGDPFAAPSKLSIWIEKEKAGFPIEYYDKKHKRIALQDMLIRGFYQQVEQYSFKAKGSGKSGLISVSRCGQEVLERTACSINESTGDMIIRFEVGFPANGRTINARELIKVLFDFLPVCVSKSLMYQNLNQKNVKEVIELSEDQLYIRQKLPEMGLIAFVANQAILPRESGISQRPMKNAVRFQSPQSLEVVLTLPYKGEVRGMGVRKGVTLIVGGGYHGKSTLLKALETGVYNHIKGDGREYVITEVSAMKIRAEDGRSIRRTDISAFIKDLPNGKDTVAFETEDASGSTSQAANVVEAIEAGAETFLIDEDTSATNFMVRDELMQQVICRDMEPITPFIERVRALYEEQGISTVLVAGSSGAYFQVADDIVQMDRYIPLEITEKAKKAASMYPSLDIPKEPMAYPNFNRIVRGDNALRRKGRVKLKTMGTDGFMINHDTVDLRYVEQLIDTEQLNMLSHILVYMEEQVFDGKKSLKEAVAYLEEGIKRDGVQFLFKGYGIPGNLAMPRIQEIYACLNRYRKL